MGARRDPLPHQDLPLRRSTSLIAQACRHHDTNSPTNNSWELGMVADRQQQMELAMDSRSGQRGVAGVQRRRST